MLFAQFGESLGKRKDACNPLKEGSYCLSNETSEEKMKLDVKNLKDAKKYKR